MGKYADIGGAGGGAAKKGAGAGGAEEGAGGGASVEGAGCRATSESAGAGGAEEGAGDGASEEGAGVDGADTGDDGEEGGGGGEEQPKVMFNAVVPSSSRRISGLAFLGEEVEWRTDVPVPLLFARMAALLLALDAVRIAFEHLVGNGLGLSTWACRVGVVERREAGFRLRGGISSRGDEDIVAVLVATPSVGVAEGRRPPSTSLLLSSRRLLLLARSLLLLPVCCGW